MHLILIYLGIFGGIFLEGEMVMITSVIAAHNGYLNINLVIAIGILGTLVSDNFYFYLGRSKGKKWIEKKEKFKTHVETINRKIEKHSTLLFLSYRFLYGFRTITPLVLGSSNISQKKFILYSFISTLIWAVLFSALGYLFGETIESNLDKIKQYEKFIIGGGILLISSFLLYRWKRKKPIKN